MHEDDNLNSDDVSAPQEPWSTPASQVHMPATSLAGFSYCIPTDHSSHPSMETISGPYGTPQDTPSRPVSTHQEFSSHFEESECLPPASVKTVSLQANMISDYWMQKPFESQYPFHGMADVPIGQAFTSDEAISVLDLEHQGLPASFQLNLDDVQSRRISGSSFSLSTSGALSDIQSYDDFSAALSDAPSFYSEMPPKSNRTSWMSSTQLSPVASPRLAPSTRSDLVRTQSRGRASPSPRPNVRSAPYMIEGPRSAKRWSTGSYGNMANRRSAPSSMYHAAPDAHMMHQPTSQPPFFMNCPPIPQRNSMLLPTQLPSQLPSQPLTTDTRHFDAPAPLLSHGLLRMLQSNADAHALHSRYADLSDPPDLFGALSEEQAPPPEEDLHPEDPEMTPREQDLRFEGDLYTPRWVRGHGNKREGWCGICKPGRWLVLKNSAYWYDKSFSHGVSAATGAQFQEPLETRRMDGNPDVWEGLCSSCDEWIALVSSKKKGTTWFRHAYKVSRSLHTNVESHLTV